MSTSVDLLREQLDQVENDLRDVGAQEADGELDAATAERLRATYRTERKSLEARIAEFEAGEAELDQGPNRRRILVGVALLLAGFVAVTVVLLNTVQERQPGELATGGVAGDVASGNIDLSQVTNEEMEAVVAENPEVVGMRLALAGRYFEEGEFDQALPHYMTVLEQDEDNVEALASVGWMTYLSGRPDVANSFVERALALQPDYVQAYWFHGTILLYGLERPADAVAPLQRLLSYDTLPDDIRAEAERMLAEAEAAS